jgi:hypothetical protein
LGSSHWIRDGGKAGAFAVSGTRKLHRGSVEDELTVFSVPSPLDAVGDPQNRAEPTKLFAEGELVRTSPFGDTNVRVPSRAKLSCQPWSCHRW